MKEQLLGEVNAMYEFFERSTRELSEDDSSFAPVDGVFTTAGQVAHIVQTIDWFIEGAFDPRTASRLSFARQAPECLMSHLLVRRPGERVVSIADSATSQACHTVQDFLLLAASGPACVLCDGTHADGSLFASATRMSSRRTGRLRGFSYTGRHRYELTLSTSGERDCLGTQQPSGEHARYSWTRRRRRGSSSVRTASCRTGCTCWRRARPTLRTFGDSSR